MPRRISLSAARLSLALLMCCFAVSYAGAATITSANFSLGFGSSVNTVNASPGSWTTTETNSANAPVTAGDANGTAITVDTDFTLTPAVLGEAFTGGGPTFFNRVLGGNGGDVSGWSFDFSANLVGAYTGTLPGGATNVQTTLNLSQVSIYAIAFTAGGFSGTSTSFHIHEATTGHTADSSPDTILGTGDLHLPENYTFVLWNPADFALSGTSASRDFNMLGFGDDTKGYVLDGFEILGNIVVSYELVPEPSSLTMLLCGVAGVLLARRRK